MRVYGICFSFDTHDINPTDFNGKFCFSFNTHDMNPIDFNDNFAFLLTLTT